MTVNVRAIYVYNEFSGFGFNADGPAGTATVMRAPMASVINIPNIVSYSVEEAGELIVYNCTVTAVCISNSSSKSEKESWQSVVIPETVTSINAGAFHNCINLIHVEIPSSVEKIEREAFRNCYSLQSISLPDGLETITTQAFWNCTSLSSVTIPSAKTFMTEAFRGCTSLTSIAIPENTTKFEVIVFRDCENLHTIYFNAEEYTDIFPDIYRGCSSFTNMVIGSNVKVIPPYLCNNLTTLLSVTIPEGVNEIGNKAFFGCAGLTTVTIPSTVNKMGGAGGAFSECTNLTEVNLLNNVIGINAFWGCTGLQRITIPQSITEFGQGAFSYCTGITEINLQNNIIGNMAFENCTGLQKLIIPQNITSFGEYAFKNCTGLTQLNFQNSVIGYGAFYDCTGLQELFIPQCITRIEKNAFSNCTGLREVIIPLNVSYIGDYAFANCADLSEVTVKWETPLRIDKYAFYSTPIKDCVLKVPPETTSLYKGTSIWTDFIIEETAGISEIISTENSAIIYWYSETDAQGYELAIYTDEDMTQMFGEYNFNASGELQNKGNQQKSASGNEYSYTLENLSRGTTYYYTLTVFGNNDEIINTYTGQFTTLLTSEIENKVATLSVGIYPNPTTGVVKIENGELKVEYVQVFNMNGKQTFETNQTEFNIGHLPAGIYLLQIKTDKGNIGKKVIITM